MNPRGSLPFHDQRLLMLEQMEQAETARLSEIWAERLHVVFAAFLCTVTLIISLNWMGAIGVGLALALGFFSFLGLIFSRHVSIILSDFYRQFQYREKFALFLAHVMVLFIPRFVFGVTVWGLLFGILLAVLCVQAMDRVWYGRIYALSFFMVFLACLHSGNAENLPPAGLVGVWFALLLLAVRFGHVRFRIEEEGRHRGINLSGMLRRTLLPVAVPCVVGYGAYLLVAGSWTPSPWRLVVEPGSTHPTPIDISVGKLMINGLILAGLAVASIAFLNWLEKKLRRRKKGTISVDETMTSTERGFHRPTDARDPLEVVHPEGPRARILAAFRAFSSALEPHGLARRPAETAEDYFTRLTTLPEEANPFNIACYDLAEVTEEEAGKFEEHLEKEMERLRSKRGESAAGEGPEQPRTPQDDGKPSEENV